ncbi:coiled-coil domain-containing protein [Holotrichia oblita]|uniref:Coiled-coil domain-containing protein n=1 Tax=Holotrichia oblita TaxID=644536 RepID=A0ACB9SMK6_HOLOL|nr:coiled-coil domain-containing protein [Holotrichia oblita]
MPLTRLSIEKMSQPMGMLMTGVSLRTVAAYFNVGHNMIRRVRMRFNDTGSDEIAMDGMESRWYLAPGQTLTNTNISDLQHALHVTATAWKKINAHLDRNRLKAEILDKERAYKESMKKGSEAMTKNWPDTIERSHSRKVEERRQRTKEIEDEKAQKYMEMTKQQENIKQAYIEKVKKSMYYSRAFPRMLNGEFFFFFSYNNLSQIGLHYLHGSHNGPHDILPPSLAVILGLFDAVLVNAISSSALLESEAIYERQKQIEFKEKLKEHDREEERQWAEKVKQAAEDEKRENLEKAQEEFRKKQKFKEMNLQEVKEKQELMRMRNENRIRKQIADNENLRKEIDLQEKMKREDMLEHSRMKKRELLDYIAKDNAFKAHIAKEEAEVAEVIQIFDEAKRRIEYLRKQKDEEILHDTIAKRAVAGSSIVTEKQAKDEAYYKCIEKAQEEAAKREEEKIQKKLEKEKKIRQERQEDHREYIEREEEAKAAEIELKRWEMLNRQKQHAVTTEYDEEKRQKDWKKTLKYRQELLEQIEERRKYDKAEREEAMKSDDYILAQIEDDEFLGYADSLVKHCEKQGGLFIPFTRWLMFIRRSIC